MKKFPSETKNKGCAAEAVFWLHSRE
jgi:hypothetical protein